jgi:hypothetical protein
MIKIKMSVFFICISMSCCVLKKEKSMFHLKGAWYQSWIKSENEKGTNICVELSEVQPGVEFDSIIFRSRRLPLFMTMEKGTIRLTSVLTSGISRISIESTVTNYPDQLLYKYLGKRHVYPIKEFRRKEMEYFKR